MNINLSDERLQLNKHTLSHVNSSCVAGQAAQVALPRLGMACYCLPGGLRLPALPGFKARGPLPPAHCVTTDKAPPFPGVGLPP